MALATTIALGAVSGVVASMNINVEQAHAKTQTLRAKADRPIYDKKGNRLIFKSIKKKQWYTANTNSKAFTAKKHHLTPVRFMDKTVYIRVGDYFDDYVQKG
ncbi:hypothetical protein [Rossellomorea marisflavi]|uniref:hypothetical protein n=1 Tax=Rossellomorea marisflavi TaxID=189381 RepID=UPI003F9F9226